jgi:hypothetical protein
MIDKLALALVAFCNTRRHRLGCLGAWIAYSELYHCYEYWSILNHSILSIV